MNGYTDIWYRSDDGLDLYARDYAMDHGSDNAPLTLLCMHGLTRNSADFEDLAAEFCPAYRVIAVDQRGRGRSAWDPSPANYQPARYVQDMFTLIDDKALENLVLIGTSMGGIMAMMMAAMRPGLFAGVVLNDIGPVVDPAGLARIKQYVGKSAPVNNREEAIDQVAATNNIAFPRYDRADWAKWVDRMYEQRDDGSLVLRYDPAISQPMAADDSSAVPADLWPLFDSLTKTPLLTIRGALSDILSADCAADMKRRHPGMTLVEVEQTGHAPMLDEPGVAEAIRAFLSDIKNA